MRKATRRENRHITCLHIFGVTLLLIALILVGTHGAGMAQERALENLKETGRAFASVAKEASPAVVFIKVEKTVSQGQFFRFGTPFNDCLLYTSPSPRDS